MRGARIVLAVVLVVGLALVPAAAAQDDSRFGGGGATDSPDETDPVPSPEPAPERENSSAETAESDLTLEELERGGRQVPDAAPSLRWLDDSGAVFVDYPSADPLAPPSEEWEVENVLHTDSTVERDEISINAQRPRDAEYAEYNLVVVHWDREWAQVDNETTEVASNKEINEHTLEFVGPRDRKTIDLPNTDGESREVTMWLEDSDGNEVSGARWTFTHESAPLTTDAGIESAGDLMKWGLLIFVLPLGIGIPVAIKGAQRVLAEVGKGPMLPPVIYGAIGVSTLFVLTVFGWRSTATAIVNQPLLFSVALVGLTFWAVLEWGGHDTIRALFVRDEIQDAQSPSGEDVHDTLYQDIADKRLVRTEKEGEFVVIEPGIRAFLARWFGKAPTLDVSDLSTQVNVRKGKWDKEFVADPTAEQALRYEAPTLGLSLTKEADRSGITGLLASVRWTVFGWSLCGGVFGWFVGGFFLGVPAVAAAIGALVGFVVPAATVNEGSIEFEAAPVHYTAARQVLAGSCKEYADAATIEELEEIAWSERSQTALAAREVQSHMDKTVTEQMLEDEIGLSGMFGDESSGDRDDGQTEDDQTDERSRQVRGDENSEETSLVPAND